MCVCELRELDKESNFWNIGLKRMYVFSSLKEKKKTFCGSDIYIYIQIISNGIYKSIEHRATVNSEKERMSIAVFFNPKLDAEIGPSASLIKPGNPPLYKRVPMDKYVKDFFSRKLDGKSYLEFMKIN